MKTQYGGTDQERIAALRRAHRGDESAKRFLVLFSVDKVLPLIGPGGPGHDK